LLDDISIIQIEKSEKEVQTSGTGVIRLVKINKSQFIPLALILLRELGKNQNFIFLDLQLGLNDDS